jgi:hypothetical protein
MKTIRLNGKRMDISAAEIRALGIIAGYDFAAPADAFASRKREDKFFKKFPRRSVCHTGDPRRINAILKKVRSA